MRTRIPPPTEYQMEITNQNKHSIMGDGEEFRSIPLTSMDEDDDEVVV